jgi:hypothetical protein
MKQINLMLTSILILLILCLSLSFSCTSSTNTQSSASSSTVSQSVTTSSAGANKTLLVGKWKIIEQAWDPATTNVWKFTWEKLEFRDDNKAIFNDGSSQSYRILSDTVLEIIGHEYDFTVSQDKLFLKRGIEQLTYTRE